MFRARPKEAIEYAGMSGAQLRHWKSQLSPLARKSGNRPSFTQGDILALRIVLWLTERVGVAVRHISGCAEQLFELCDESNWDRIQHQVAVLRFPQGTLELLPRNQPVLAQAIASSVVIDLGEFVTCIRRPRGGELDGTSVPSATPETTEIRGKGHNASRSTNSVGRT